MIPGENISSSIDRILIIVFGAFFVTVLKDVGLIGTTTIISGMTHRYIMSPLPLFVALVPLVQCIPWRRVGRMVCYCGANAELLTGFETVISWSTHRYHTGIVYRSNSSSIAIGFTISAWIRYSKQSASGSNPRSEVPYRTATLMATLTRDSGGELD